MQILKYRTSIKDNKFLEKSSIKDANMPDRFESKLINIYPDINYQQFMGFGGAITESSGYVYSKLNEDKKKDFINSYFSETGLNYSLVRLPIGSCDFSLKSYSYSNKEDLSDFSVEKDKEYLLPLLKDANNKNNLTLFSSIWSPPRFMKTTKMLTLRWKT